MGYITENHFEMLVQRAAQKTNKDPDNIRDSIREFLIEKQGVTIGIPLAEQVRQAQVEAAENVVIANLNRTLNGKTPVPGKTLLSQVKGAQVRAGEDTVIKSLRKKGLGKHGLRVVK